MTTIEMIAVMQSYVDGKEIQYKLQLEGDDSWSDIYKPSWDWQINDYRVKPESKYVPYDSVSEVNRDQWVVTKTRNIMCQIEATNRFDDTVYLVVGGWVHLDTLFKDFTYEDGTPCGKRVEV